MAVLKTENLKKYYGKDAILVRALDGVDLSVEKGEFLSIVGTSGSGKSTLLHMLGGLDRPTEGTVYVGRKRYFRPEGRGTDYFPQTQDRIHFPEF